MPQNGESGQRSIRSMAASYADSLQAVYRGGPYKILGWSLGGVVAQALAIELQRRGCKVECLVLLDDAFSTNTIVGANDAGDESQMLEHILLMNHIEVPDQPVPLTYPQALRLITQRLDAVQFALPSERLLEFMVKNLTTNQLHLQHHVPDIFDGDMVIFSAARGLNGNGPPHPENWQPYVTGEITVYPVDCTHHEMLTSASLSKYMEQLKCSLEEKMGFR
jgi:thioesterase domain-containing protein